MKKEFIYILFLPCFLFSELSLEECSKILDDSKRLNCFDNLASSQTNKQEANKDRVQTNVTYKANNIENYGLKKKSIEVKEITGIDSKITKIKKLNSYNLVISLENGQKWRSVEKYRYHRLKPSQIVTISDGAISGHVLKVNGEKIAIRVKRIK